MNRDPADQAHTIEAAREIYNIERWAGGYFDINVNGEVAVKTGHVGATTLGALIGAARGSGLSFPILLRFNHILRDRVDLLCGAFATATDGDEFRGRHTAVYPIKVNQQRSVVEQIVRYGGRRVGLEAGSKPELMAVMALADVDGVIVCNGYKDREYIRLALIGRELGYRIYIVIEKLSELETVLAESRALGVQPLLGVRVRLASIGAGKWQNTGGEKSKFGLSAAQMLQAVGRLRETGLLGSLELLHMHLGSQLPNIRDIQRGMREIARYYVELHRLGVNVRCVDVGGGLGIDYEGTRSRSFCSMNYTVQEYANNVVHALWEACADHGLPHPDLITEAGRAMTAHHAVLVTNVIDTDQRPHGDELPPTADDEPTIIRNLRQLLDQVSQRAALESYHDAAHWMAEANDMYVHGALSLESRALAEQLYFAICHRVRPLLQAVSRAQRDVLDELNEKLADKYFVNFSVFQSVPDVWAIDQIFPIMPLHRLDEPPTRRAALQDLTCDSDGRIDHYVDREGVESTLPLHPLVRGEPYLLGIFLVGAYQEILGDMHNLFGDTDAVNVEVDAAGGFELLSPQRGDTVDSVLRYVHFNADELLAAFRDRIGATALDAATRSARLAELEAGLSGYTYLEE